MGFTSRWFFPTQKAPANFISLGLAHPPGKRFPFYDFQPLPSPIEKAAGCAAEPDKGEAGFGGQTYRSLPASSRETLPIYLPPRLRGMVSQMNYFVGRIQITDSVLEIVNCHNASGWPSLVFYSPPMKVSNPIVIRIPDSGLIAREENESKCRVAAEYYLPAIRVRLATEGSSSYQGLPVIFVLTTSVNAAMAQKEALANDNGKAAAPSRLQFSGSTRTDPEFARIEYRSARQISCASPGRPAPR